MDRNEFTTRLGTASTRVWRDYVRPFFRRFNLLPEFVRRLRHHFIEAVMGASLSGVAIFVISLVTSLPHWAWGMVLIGAFFCSAYASWREEYVTTHKPEGSGINLGRIVRMRSHDRALERSAQATEQLAQEMRRQHLPDVAVIARESAVSMREGRLRIDVALEITNRGADTSLRDWRIIAQAPERYRCEMADDAFLKEEKASTLLTWLERRQCVNLAIYSDELRRGGYLLGWLACEATIPAMFTTQTEQIGLDIQVRDHLNNRVDVWGPLVRK
jgi:hypothetical protein